MRVDGTSVLFFDQVAGRVCSVVDDHQQTRGGLKGAQKSCSQEWKEECWRRSNHGGEQERELVMEYRKHVT